MLIALIGLALLTASADQPPSPANATTVVVAPCPAMTEASPVAQVGIGPTRQPTVMAPMVMPRTPPGLRKTAGVAHVEVRATVDVDGRPCDLMVMSQSHPELGADRVSLSAVRQWRFEPATRDGGPVRAIVTLEFRYEARAPEREGASPGWFTGTTVRGAVTPSGLWSQQDLSPEP